MGSRTRGTIATLVLGAMLMLAGCGTGGVQSIPLPGGVDVGSDPRTYRIEFDDILDLVPQSMVKMNGIPVGRVTSVEVPDDEWHALVSISVRNDVDLSDRAEVSVQQTSLLGEKFVSLSEPEGSQDAPRQNPDAPITLTRTRTATDIEQVLGALSMLLTGGGINQLERIVSELNTAFDGRDETFSALLEESSTLIAGLNEQRDDIVRAIDGLATLSSTASSQTEQIERILDELPAGVAVLEEQRPEFVELLTKLDELGEVGTDVLGKSREALINDLKALRPVLTELTKAAPDMITAAPLILTHPFPDWLLPGVHGDSTNLFMTLDLRILNQLEALGVGQGTPKYVPPARVNVPIDKNNPYVNGNGARWGWPTVGLLPPAPNSRPGPNTPPSGGTYPMNPQYSTMPVPADEDQGLLDGPLSMIGVGK